MLRQDDTEYLLNLGQKEKPPVPPKEKAPQTESIDKMRERLELRRLQIELDKLEKPDTSIDYYSKMLELQEKSFMKQIEMIQQQGNLKLEIEKLKIAQETQGGDWGEELLSGILPLLPELLKKQEIANKEKETLRKQQQEKKGVSVQEMGRLMTAKEMKDYKQQIKAGAITLETAYEDFKKNFPQLVAKVPLEVFKLEFEKIKNG
jgi:hypothetical protein